MQAATLVIAEQATTSSLYVNNIPCGLSYSTISNRPPIFQWPGCNRQLPHVLPRGYRMIVFGLHFMRKPIIPKLPSSRYVVSRARSIRCWRSPMKSRKVRESLQNDHAQLCVTAGVTSPFTSGYCASANASEKSQPDYSAAIHQRF
jgi:hypothetical protein